MANDLTPKEAAAAVAVYGIRLSADVETAFKKTMLRDSFSF